MDGLGNITDTLTAHTDVQKIENYLKTTKNARKSIRSVNGAKETKFTC